jgi:hypothetical protein
MEVRFLAVISLRSGGNMRSSTSPGRGGCLVESLEQRTFLDGTPVQIVIPVNENQILTFPQTGRLHINITFKYCAGSVTVTGTDLVQTPTRTGISVSGTLLSLNQVLVNQAFSPKLSDLTVEGVNYPRTQTSWFQLQGIEDTVPMNQIKVRRLELDGSATFDELNYLRISEAMDSSISGAVSKRMAFGNVSNSTISDSEPLCCFCCCDMTSSSPGESVLLAPAIRYLRVRKDFDADLILSGSSTKKYTLDAFSAALIDGTWNVSGNTHSITTGSVNSPFVGSFGEIDLFKVRQNFTGSLTAGSLGTLDVGNSLTSSTLNFTNPYLAGAFDLSHLNVGNYIESTNLNSTGNIYAIHTMYTYYSNIEAGISPGYVFGMTPTSADYTSPCWIESFYSDCPSMHYEHFIGSYVGAYNFGTVHVGNVVTNNYGSPIGFAGYQFDSLRFGLGAIKPRFKDLLSETQFTTDLSQQHETPSALGDFHILLPYNP